MYFWPLDERVHIYLFSWSRFIHKFSPQTTALARVYLCVFYVRDHTQMMGCCGQPQQRLLMELNLNAFSWAAERARAREEKAETLHGGLQSEHLSRKKKSHEFLHRTDMHFIHNCMFCCGREVSSKKLVGENLRRDFDDSVNFYATERIYWIQRFGEV